MQCRKKAIKWINGRRFDHYSDIEYFKQKELNILPIKFKFVLNDILMYYKIINLLVHIKLPEHFTFIEAEQVRYTRQTSAIINDVDKTLINVILDQPVKDLGIVSSIGQWTYGTVYLSISDK